MHEGECGNLVAALQMTTRDLVSVALASLTAVDDLGLIHTRMLFAVDDRPGISGIELASTLGTSASTVTRQADRLVQSGHLLREPNPTNRSMVMLQLTERGRQAVDDVLSWRARIFERVARRLDPAEQAALTAALHHVHAALTAHAPGGLEKG